MIDNECKNLKKEDITPWHGDVFDHPHYRYICKITGKEVIKYFCCNNKTCKYYNSSWEGE